MLNAQLAEKQLCLCHVSAGNSNFSYSVIIPSTKRLMCAIVGYIKMNII